MPYVHNDLQKYTGGITDTDRWLKFEYKPSDTFVCTPPKCGTTWTLTIVSMLQTGKTDISPHKLVQWVDAKVVPIDEMKASLTAQTHNRCIKTHTPFDGVPWFSNAAYVAVYRHPIDVLFSLRKHLANAYDTAPDDPYLGTDEEALDSYIMRVMDREDFDNDCLASVVAHYKSFTKSPRPENLLILHYADMLADARGAIETIAKHIGVNADAALIDAILEATSFDEMKSKSERYTPFSDFGYWRDPQAFFDSAGTHKWRGKLSESAVSRYRNQIAQMLDPADINWLENGSRDRPLSSEKKIAP